MPAALEKKQDLSKLALLEDLSRDRVAAVDAFFGPDHKDAMPPFHVELIGSWAAADTHVLVEGFRQSAKTTLALEFLTMEALFGNLRFALFICDNFKKACEKLDIVRYHLTTNDRIIGLFGRTVGKKDNESVIHLKNGVRIEAMGREQSPRGLLHHVSRPDRIFIDDAENRERGDVDSEERVSATMRWLYADVIPALDIKSGKIRINGTPLARDCMVTRLKNDKMWASRSYPICSGDIDSKEALPLWPERYPMHWIRRERDMYQAQGMLTSFMQEFMVVAEEESEKIFPSGGLRETFSSLPSWVPCYAQFDPARTAKKTSNLTGFCVNSWHGSKLTVLESGGERFMPSEIISKIFDINDRYHPIAIGVESNSLEEFLMEPLRVEMVRRRTVLPIVELRAPQHQSKHDFIKGLQPFHQAGQILLLGGAKMHSKLVSEMETFPSKNDDVINALAYALRMRIGTPVYEDFGASNVVEDAAPQRASPVYLAFNSSGKETTCAAMQLVGQELTLLEEWAIPGDLKDAVETIKLSANGIFARQRIVAFCPSDLYEDWARIPLVRILRDAKLSPSRGSTYLDSRGSLASYIRTTIRERRALTVSVHCKQSLAAFAGGYAVAIGPTGRNSENAVDNAYKTLVQGVESLVTALNGKVSTELSANFATSPDGQRFITSRPGVSFAKR